MTPDDDWSTLRLQVAGGSEKAVDFVRAVFTVDDNAAPRAVIATVTDDGEVAGFIHGALSLCYRTAHAYRSDLGLMALHAALLEEAESPSANKYSRSGAALASAHFVCSNTLDCDDPVGLVGTDPSLIYNYGAEAFNTAIDEAADDFNPVLIESIRHYRRLLPEVGPDAISVVAKQVWKGLKDEH